MKRWTLIAAAVALFAVVSQAADDKADRPRGQRGLREGAQMLGNLLPPKQVEELKLTAEQKGKYDVLQEKFAKEHKAWVESHHTEGEALRAQLNDAREAKDEAKINELRVKMREHAKPVEQMRKRYMDEVRSFLTEDQKKQLDEARERRGSPSERGGRRRASDQD